MTFPRPLTKTILKKLCLRTLLAMEDPHHWLAPGPPVGNRPGIVRHYRNIALKYVPLMFRQEIEGGLDRDEERLALRAMFELLRDGYITPEAYTEEEFVYGLTEAGRAAAAGSLEDAELVSISLQDILSHPVLLSRVADDFYSGEHESAVLKAFKMVEEAVRSRAGLPPESHGQDVFGKAFGTDKPRLRHPGALTAAEQASLVALMRGSYGWCRNPAGHRTVSYADARHVAQILGLADLLLTLVDESSPLLGDADPPGD